MAFQLLSTAEFILRMKRSGLLQKSVILLFEALNLNMGRGVVADINRQCSSEMLEQREFDLRTGLIESTFPAIWLGL